MTAATKLVCEEFRLKGNLVNKPLQRHTVDSKSSVTLNVRSLLSKFFFF